jgi:transcriptional regulator with XRE-family HTH domain
MKGVSQSRQSFTNVGTPLRVGGIKIRELREGLGMSQQQVADQSGLSRQKVSDLERGHSATVGGQHLQLLAVTLGCDVADIAPELATNGGVLFSESVRDLRESIGLDAKTVAEEIGVSFRAYVHYESRHKRAPLKVAWRLDSFLKKQRGLNLPEGFFAYGGAAAGSREAEYLWLEYRDNRGVWQLDLLGRPGTHGNGRVAEPKSLFSRLFRTGTKG